MSKRVSVIAELSIIPVGQGTTSLGKYVGEAVSAVSGLKGLRCEVTAMGTILEAEKLETILEAVKLAHEAVSRMGAQRIESTLRIDDRRDKPRRMEDKIEAVRSYIQR